MNNAEGAWTEIVEVPAVRKGEYIESFNSPKILNMSQEHLEAFADTIGGTLVFLKMRAVYSQLETELCEARGCHEKVEEDHLCRWHTGKGQLQEVGIQRKIWNEHHVLPGDSRYDDLLRDYRDGRRLVEADTKQEGRTS